MAQLAIRCSTFDNVTDGGDAFRRGPFRLSIYAHRSKPITFEVREYHDFAEVTGWSGIVPGRALADRQRVTLEVLRDSRADVLDVTFDRITREVERIAADPSSLPG